MHTTSVSVAVPTPGKGSSSVASILKFAARAATWRSTPNPPLVGLSVLVGWALMWALVHLAIQYVGATPSPSFTPYGLNALIAWLAIMLAVAAFFASPQARTTVLAAMLALTVVLDVVFAAIRLVLVRFLPPTDPSELVSSWFPSLSVDWLPELVEVALPASTYVLPAAFWIGGMCAIVYSFEPGARLRLFGRVVALWVALIVAKALIPQAPVFIAADFDVGNANWWEYVGSGRLNQAATKLSERIAELRSGTRKRTAAQVEKAQPSLLQTAIEQLRPQTPGTTDVYALGVAGWAELDVFVKEIDGALGALGQILPIQDRSVRLINNRETVDTAPLASRRNFAAAVHGIAERMDKDEDVLLLVMSSHGNATGFSLQLPAGSTQLLTPHEVKGVLDAEGIKNRVLIVSACFSGTFVAPFANDDTIVLTAADEKSTSFGCAAQRDWTYFGDAFFRQGLHPGTDLRRAFDHARILIRGWEMMDRLPPSNPQAHFGPALTVKLDPVLRSMTGQ
jgi:peptidase C13-like protein